MYLLAQYSAPEKTSHKMIYVLVTFARNHISQECKEMMDKETFYEQMSVPQTW